MKSNTSVFFIEAELITKIIRKRFGNKHIKILDIGCGYGHISHILAHAIPKSQITAIDNSKELIEKIKNMYICVDNLSFKKCNILKKLPFKNKQFDVCISTGYTCAGSIQGALQNIKKITKDDGLILLDYRRPYNIYAILTGHIIGDYNDYQKKYKSPIYGEKYNYGKIGLKKYYETNQCKIKKIHSIYTFPRIGSIKFQLFFEKTIGKILNIILSRIYIVELEKK